MIRAQLSANGISFPSPKAKKRFNYILPNPIQLPMSMSTFVVIDNTVFLPLVIHLPSTDRDPFRIIVVVQKFCPIISNHYPPPRPRHLSPSKMSSTDPTPPTPPAPSQPMCTTSCLKSLLKTGATDFRLVFFYPLCTGVMTGVGFILGKRLGERYFYPNTSIAKPI